MQEQVDSLEDGEKEIQEKRKHKAGLLGCFHYRRRCKLVAPCCGEVFWCRHCHNDVKLTNEWDPQKRHELDRKAVVEVVCAICELQQPIADSCRACGVAFGTFACMVCKFFDDDVTKLQFHCDKCGICRVGGRENFFHCDKCGCCYANILQDNHTCVENSMRQNCPVCFEYLFDSVRTTAVLPCGHTVHSACLHALLRTSCQEVPSMQEMEAHRQLTCPICMKSYGDMHPTWSRLDQEIASTPMPAEYASWQVDVLCNDCLRPGRVSFHIFGLKCPHCQSYNTRRIGLDRQGNAPPAPVAENGSQ